MDTTVPNMEHDWSREIDHSMCQITFTDRFGTSKIGEAVTYHIAAGGNRTRARMAMQFCNRLGMSVTDALPIAVASEAVHNASLILDDLHDQDRDRRGVPSVWVKFGAEVASLASQLLVSAGYAALAKGGYGAVTGDLVSLFHSRIASTIYGQEMDLYSAAGSTDEAVDTDEWSHYVRCAIAKSGGLLSLPVELPLIAAGHAYAVNSAKSAMAHFGVAYQIVDDITDFTRDEHREEKHSAPNAVRYLLDEKGDAESFDKAISVAREHFEWEIALAVQYAQKIPGSCHEIIEDEGARLRHSAGSAV